MDYTKTQEWQDYLEYKKHIQSIEIYQDCESCYHFGGCMCDNLDENGNCLGWEPIDWKSQDENKKQEIKFFNSEAFLQLKEEFEIYKEKKKC